MKKIIILISLISIMIFAIMFFKMFNDCGYRSVRCLNGVQRMELMKSLSPPDSIRLAISDAENSFSLNSPLQDKIIENKNNESDILLKMLIRENELKREFIIARTLALIKFTHGTNICKNDKNRKIIQTVLERNRQRKNVYQMDIYYYLRSLCVPIGLR